MFFRKRGKLRREEDERLLQAIDRMKMKYDNHRHYLEHSFDPSDDSIKQMKLVESLYSFLIREARIRQVRKNKL
ncbi:YaaL family protein [Alkalihalobacillus sp. 1P02AB]|uniref:YaaL family protein n=1 Tax=Alkalihalobacillus sp. 1P02AB TaxID=3132260 RepID=UPI0039A61014